MSSDRNSELATLAACLISKTARDEARKHITGADFLQPQHEAIWDAMSRLDKQRRNVDPSTVLSVVGADPATARILPDLITWPAVAEHVADYAGEVRDWATRRRLYDEALRVQQIALNPEANAQGLAASVATRFANLRDTGISEDAQSITLGELLAEEDDEPEWVVPGLLERRDRFMLTGTEGLGKSYLLRQIAVMAAAGLDPFDPGIRIPPINVLIVDCENSYRQVKRKVRPVVEFARRYGSGRPDFVNLICSPRIDIARDKDLAKIHREMDATQPDIVVIGPLYRISKGALQTDDDAAPVLAGLDTLRERDCALLIEAHAGHATSGAGVRDLRPRGSSALMGWPEFGYGMRALSPTVSDVVAWRGDREARNWPDRLRRSNDGIRWIPCDATPIQPDWS